MAKTQRILFFFGFAVPALVALYFITRSNFAPLDPTIITIVFSALIMLAFTSLFLEHYFSRPTDVLSAAIAILLMLAPVKTSLNSLGIWYWVFIGYVAGQAFSATLSLFLLNKDRSPQSWQNRASYFLNKFSSHFGNGRLLFFALFFLMLIFYISDQTKTEFLLLSSFGALWILVDPKKFAFSLIGKKSSTDKAIGEIFGVQSKNTFLAKLYEDRVKVKRFDPVEFRYSTDQITRRGLIIDNYFLNESQWVKILCSNEIQEHFKEVDSIKFDGDNILHKMESEPPDFLDRFVGIVIEGSTIQKLRFEYAQKAKITDGSLLSAKVTGMNVLYQVVQGTTTLEVLEQKNESGFITGEALQLGVWSNASTFQKFGWLPDMNTPLYLAENIAPPALADNEYQIGEIKGTNYPSIINLTESVTHHTAILGITGSGKSVFARNLIRQIAQQETKIIIVDLTNEYSSKLQDIGAAEIVSPAVQIDIFQSIRRLTAEKAKFLNQQDQNLISQKEQIISDSFSAAITNFLQSDNVCALLGLPDLSNTEEIFDYTRCFFKELFQIARNDGNFGNRVCVVLEEAHTIVPEYSFSGASSKNAGALVNSIAQVALQGRKYDIGFIVIGQRTANISKTVLTQCNSIVAFQQFDKTSTEFLAAYFGTDMASSLPRLEQRQAIAAGKAFRAKVPMIFEVPNIVEP